MLNIKFVLILLLLISHNPLFSNNLRDDFTCSYQNDLLEVVTHQNLKTHITNTVRDWIQNHTRPNLLFPPATPPNRIKIGFYGCNTNGNCHFYENPKRYGSSWSSQGNNVPNVRYQLRNAYANAHIGINDFWQNYELRNILIQDLTDRGVVLANNTPQAPNAQRNDFSGNYLHSEQAFISHLQRQNQHPDNENNQNIPLYNYFIFIFVSTNPMCPNCRDSVSYILNNNHQLLFNNHISWSRMTNITQLNEAANANDNNIYYFNDENNYALSPIKIIYFHSLGNNLNNVNLHQNNNTLYLSTLN